MTTLPDTQTISGHRVVIEYSALLGCIMSFNSDN